MKLKNLFLLTLCTTHFLFLFSQNNKNIEASTLTLPKFLELAAKNKEFQILALQKLEIENYELRKLPSLDIKLAAGGSASFDSSSSTKEVVPTYSGYINGGKTIYTTGTEVELGVTSKNMKVGSKGDHTLSFALSQPLLNNRFGKMNRIRKELIQRESEILYFQIAEEWENYYGSLIAIYLNWLTTQETLSLSEKALTDNMKLLENTKARKNLGVANNNDLDRMKLQISDKQESVLNAKANYAKTMMNLLNILEIESNVSFVPTWEGVENFFTLGNKTNNRTLRIAKLLEQNKKGLSDLASEALLPYLSVSYSLKAPLFKNETERSSGSALSATSSAAALNNTFEIQLSFPLLSTKERAENRYAELEWRKAGKEFSRAKIEYVSKIKNSDIDLENIREKLNLGLEKEKTAKRLYETFETEYKRGETTMTDLISVVNTLENIRYRNSLLKIESMVALLNRMQLTDSLIYVESAK